MSTTRITPIDYGHGWSAQPDDVRHGMQLAVRFEQESQESIFASQAGIADFSCLPRFSVKGPKAAEWLQAQQVELPAEVNTWCQSGASLVLRLGMSEYLMEDQAADGTAARLQQAVLAGSLTLPAQVYPVARNDAVLVLTGNRLNELFSETCALDLEVELAHGVNGPDSPGNRVLMTQLAGISVVLLRQQGASLVYRLWCDGSYGSYLWHTLTEIAAEVGGGAIGFDRGVTFGRDIRLGTAFSASAISN